MILNQLPPGYQSFVKATPQSQHEDMVPEPDFKHNTLMKAAYQSVEINPSEDDPCAVPPTYAVQLLLKNGPTIPVDEFTTTIAAHIAAAPKGGWRAGII